MSKNPAFFQEKFKIESPPLTVVHIKIFIAALLIFDFTLQFIARTGQLLSPF